MHDMYTSNNETLHIGMVNSLLTRACEGIIRVSFLHRMFISVIDLFTHFGNEELFLGTSCYDVTTGFMLQPIQYGNP